MTIKEWSATWKTLTQLWPGTANNAWSDGDAVADAWMRRLQPEPKEAVAAAIQAHYEESGPDSKSHYAPSISRIYALVGERKRSGNVVSEDRQRIERRWHSMHPIEQAIWAAESCRTAAFRSDAKWEKDKLNAQAAAWEETGKRIKKARAGKACCPLHEHLYV